MDAPADASFETFRIKTSHNDKLEKPRANKVLQKIISKSLESFFLYFGYSVWHCLVLIEVQ